MFDANQILFDHACETMPDSLSQRRLVLQALKIKTNPRHRAHLKICAQIAALDSVTDLQAQLQSEIKQCSRQPRSQAGKTAPPK